MATLAEMRNTSVSNLPEVSDPEKVYADITRQDFEEYLKDYRGFEGRLIAAKDDTSLIDQAREDALKQNQIAREIQQRNIERYGGAGLSAMQRQEQQRAFQRSGALGLAGGLNQARVTQRDINQRTLADLINIGQGVNRSSLQGLQEASQLQASRESSYTAAKAAHSAQMMQMGAGLGSLALIAFGI